MTSPTSSSNSVAGHMMYPGGHTVMYATPTSSIGDGSLTVLNTFPTTGHAQSHDPGKRQIVKIFINIMTSSCFVFEPVFV